MTTAPQPVLVVDVIIPIHNAVSTIQSSVQSALNQVIPTDLESFFNDKYRWDVAVCCFDDGSTDDSWDLLTNLQKEYQQGSSITEETRDTSCNDVKSLRRLPGDFHLLIARGADGSRGAGFARNQAASLRSKLIKSTSSSPFPCRNFLCLLDSDDIMHCTRIAAQVHYFLTVPSDEDELERTLLGCTFNRDPPDSTWHYAQWANGLSDERLYLERFREVTIIQPTWMMCRSRFESLGKYLEAPTERGTMDQGSFCSEAFPALRKSPTVSLTAKQHQPTPLCLIHPSLDTPNTLRLAEDLRFFHAHVHGGGLLKLLRTEIPLVTYRHRAGMSQSSNTPRKLLLQLRVLAFEICILRNDPGWTGDFVVWGAGRDGKDFVKNLADDTRKRVMCMVDVDAKKIESGYYSNGDICIPIVHFSWLARDAKVCKLLYEKSEHGSINKSKSNDSALSQNCEEKVRIKPMSVDIHRLRPVKKPRPEPKLRPPPTDLDLSQLPSLPVVVCVSMYRTSGALEQNVQSIGRTEGKNLWHFN